MLHGKSVPLPRQNDVSVRFVCRSGLPAVAAAQIAAQFIVNNITTAITLLHAAHEWL